VRQQKFTGDNIPEIELHTLFINGKEIDVLIIFDSPQKPYYLNEDYRDNGIIVKANFIYTRTNDSNKPFNKSADIGIIEKMWKQRFGLDLSQLDKMKALIHDFENWEKLDESGNYSFHKQNPEYVIESFDDHSLTTNRDTLDFFYLNIQKSTSFSQFKYHSTVLFEINVILPDECRIRIPRPDFQYLQKIETLYYYF